jgi:hypothetical protein
MPVHPMPLPDLLHLFTQIDVKLSELQRRLPLNAARVGRSPCAGHHHTSPAFVAQVRPLKSKSCDIAGNAGRDGAF